MMSWIGDISIRQKLILSFLIIIGINAALGYQSIVIIRDLNKLVRTTYDKALMSAAFSQAAMYNFSQIDSELKSLLFATNEKEFEIHSLFLEEAFETLDSDLSVVKERMLDHESETEIGEIKEQLSELAQMKNTLVKEKEKIMTGDHSLSSVKPLIEKWEKNRFREKLGRRISALHDRAAELGYDFRITSDKKNDATLKRSIIVLVSCLVLSFIVSLVVAYLIIKPLYRLKTVCQEVQAGDFEKRMNLNSKNELGEVSRVFDYMLDTIKEKTNDLTSLLSGLPFSVFYFNSDGKISKEKSEITDQMFPSIDNFEGIGPFLESYGAEKEGVETVVGAIFDETFAFEQAAFLLPQEIKSSDGSQVVKLDYRPNFKKEKIEKVILIGEDISEKIQIQNENERNAQRVEIITMALTNLQSFHEYLVQVSELYRILSLKVSASDPLSVEGKRDLHSLKGMLGVYGFKTCAELINQTETSFEETDFQSGKMAFDSSHDQFLDLKNDVEDVLNLSENVNFTQISKDKIKRLKDQLSKFTDIDSTIIRECVNSLDRLPAGNAFVGFVRYVDKLNREAEDKNVVLKIDEESDELTIDEVKEFDIALTHLINNSFVHGIESAAERIHSGKPEQGEIVLSYKRMENNGGEVSLRDNGQGINYEKLLMKAKEKGLLAEDVQLSDEVKKEILFLSGLSSKDSSDQLAGRGVGLDAVKSEIEKKGGEILHTSMPKVGTTFTIRI